MAAFPGPFSPDAVIPFCLATSRLSGEGYEEAAGPFSDCLSRVLGRDMALPLSLLGRHTLAPFLLPPTLWLVLFFSTVLCQMQRCPSLGKERRQGRTLFCKTTATKNTFFFFSVVQANLNHHYFTQMCTLQALCACPSSRRTRTGGQPSRLSRYAARGANRDLPSLPEICGPSHLLRMMSQKSLPFELLNSHPSCSIFVFYTDLIRNTGTSK